MPRLARPSAVAFDALLRRGAPALLCAAVAATPALGRATESAPATPAAPAAAPAATPATANSAAARQAEERRKRVEFIAQREGYKIIEKDGERLYCMDDYVLGSRVRKQRTCLNEEQLEIHLDLDSAAAREILDKGLRGFTPNRP
jgi:hypothetical protein